MAREAMQRKEGAMVIETRPRAPVRDSIFNVRLSQAERDRLERFAVEKDLRIAQAVRLLVREHTPAATEAARSSDAA